MGVVPDDPYAHLADRGDEGWAEVMRLPPMAPSPPGSFMDLTHKVVFGDLWHRPNLSTRDRRLVTLTALAALGRQDITPIHIGAALRSGDLAPAELEELVVHVAFYLGWPAAAALHLLVAKEIAAFREANESPS